MVGITLSKFRNERLEGTTTKLKLSDLLNIRLRESLLRDQRTLRIGEREGSSAKLDNFESSILGDISGPRDGDESRRL